MARIDSFLRQKLLQKTSAGCFVSGGIGRVDAQIRDEGGFCFALLGLVLTAGCFPAVERGDDEEECESERKNVPATQGGHRYFPPPPAG